MKGIITKDLKIEYTSNIDFTFYGDFIPKKVKDTLPIHPNDYNYAENHIGQEVDFEIYVPYISADKDLDEANYAKLNISPTTAEILYKENEVKKLAEDSWNAYHHNDTFEEWWEDNKKQ